MVRFQKPILNLLPPSQFSRTICQIKRTSTSEASLCHFTIRKKEKRSVQILLVTCT